MLLSDHDLRLQIAKCALVVDPWDITMLQPASIDLRLGSQFRVFPDLHIIDPLNIPDDFGDVVEPLLGDPFMLCPGDFVLGATVERVRLPGHLAARLEGKSTLGRLGLQVHSTAGFIDPGFDGQITLELTNVARSPIRLWPGMKISQLCVFTMTSSSDRPYGSAGLGSRYQHQHGPQAARADLFPHPRGHSA